MLEEIREHIMKNSKILPYLGKYAVSTESIISWYLFSL